MNASFFVVGNQQIQSPLHHCAVAAVIHVKKAFYSVGNAEAAASATDNGEEFTVSKEVLVFFIYVLIIYVQCSETKQYLVP